MSARAESLRKLVALATLPGGLGALARARSRSLSALMIATRMKRCGIVPRHILDVGANRGKFAAACRAVFPDARITAVEPTAVLAKGIEALFSDDARVRVLCTAFGAARETRPFNVNVFSPASSFLPLKEAHHQSFPHAVDTTLEDVKIVPLDEAVAEGRIEPPDLIKLDVQGYELEVLRGATETLKATGHVIAEASFRPLYEGEPPLTETVSFMQERGFVCLGALDTLADPATGLMLQADLLFQRGEG